MVFTMPQGKGGSIPLDFVRLQLWNYLPNGRSTAFYLISAMRKKHPDWFRHDLNQLFELLGGRLLSGLAGGAFLLAHFLEHLCEFLQGIAGLAVTSLLLELLGELLHRLRKVALLSDCPSAASIETARRGR